MHQLQNAKDLDALMEDVGERPLVMLGEASHGTHEFYTWRTAITKRLVEEKGFRFVAVEGDWPDCYRINRYIKKYTDSEKDVVDVLKGFDRWPTWMWANWEVAALAEWLRSWNTNRNTGHQVGFYGLDVYSLWDSMREMLSFLQEDDPQAAQSVKQAIRCFEPFEENEHLYAQYAWTDQSCRDKVLALLKEVSVSRMGVAGEESEAAFSTGQNALVAVNAERYYSTMMNFDHESWNIRDTHMMETLDRLLQFHGRGSKAVVWAHNTHIGDARATDMKKAGMVNLGQLAREHCGLNQVYLVGFGTYEGKVIAGEEWGAPMKEMEVPPARKDSIEDHWHHEGRGNQLVLFNEEANPYSGIRAHRAIGVVYHPERERYGNYVPSRMAERYDAFLYLEKTTALHPFGHAGGSHQIPDAWPFGY